MSQNFDLLDTFAEHEDIAFKVSMYDRAGAYLANPASATIKLVITSDAARDTNVAELSTGVGTEIVLTDAGTSTFQFKIPTAKAALLTPGTVFYFDVWSIDATDGRMHQVDGKIRLRVAGKEA